MFVKPAPGLVVIHPETFQPLSAEGIAVPDGDLHWSRMLGLGDVVETDPPPPPAPKTRQRRAASKPRSAK